MFYNGIFVPKYDKPSVIKADMCIKPCSVTIISQNTKCMTVLKVYPTSGTEHYQLIRLHDFVVN